MDGTHPIPDAAIAKIIRNLLSDTFISDFLKINEYGGKSWFGKESAETAFLPDGDRRNDGDPDKRESNQEEENWRIWKNWPNRSWIFKMQQKSPVMISIAFLRFSIRIDPAAINSRIFSSIPKKPFHRSSRKVHCALR